MFENYLIRTGNTFNEVMNPYFEALNKIGVPYAPSPEDSLAQILAKLRDPLKWVVSTVFLMGVVFFVYKGVLAGIPYFSAENPQERSQAKDKLKNALLGAAFCVAGTVLINLLLNAFGATQGWEFE